MRKIIFIFSIFLLTSQIHAETMTGGGYTLNGSVDAIIGQGQGGGYTLNANGDPISTQNSSGGTYTLYPTPYAKPIVPPTPGTGTPTQEVIRSVTYGTQVPNYQEYVEGTNQGTPGTPINPQNPTNPNYPNNPVRPGTNPNTPTSNTGNNNGGSYTGGSTSTSANGEFMYPESEDPDNVNFGKGNTTKGGVAVGEKKTCWWCWIIILIIILLILRWWRRRMRDR